MKTQNKLKFILSKSDNVEWFTPVRCGFILKFRTILSGNVSLQ